MQLGAEDTLQTPLSNVYSVPCDESTPVGREAIVALLFETRKPVVA